MSVRRIVPTLALVLALGASDAQAFFDPPWITPAMPRAGESVSVNIRGGECDSIFEHPGYPQVTRQGDAIRILEYGDHRSTAELCIYPIGTLSAPLGGFPPGEYTLTVDFIYNDYLFGPTIINLGVIPFTVGGTTAGVPVPTLSPARALVLVFVLGGAPMWCVRRRSAKPLFIRRIRSTVKTTQTAT